MLTKQSKLINLESFIRFLETYDPKMLTGRNLKFFVCHGVHVDIISPKVTALKWAPATITLLGAEHPTALISYLKRQALEGLMILLNRINALWHIELVRVIFNNFCNYVSIKLKGFPL